MKLIEFSDDGRVVMEQSPASFDLKRRYKEAGRKVILIGATPISAMRSYFDGRRLLPRKTASLHVSRNEIAADGIDVSVVSGIPEGANISVHLDGALLDEFTSDGSAVEVTADKAGEYELRVEAAYLLPCTARIVAT